MTTKKEKPQILVTGAGGELAHLAIQELKKKYQIIGVDFREQSHYDDKTIRYRIDINKRGFEDIFRNHTIQGLIHLGRIRFTSQDRYRRYHTNVVGTQKLLDLSAKYGLEKVVILSTYHVYGAHPYNPSLIEETFPLKAVSMSSELADAVEVENLSTIYMLKHPKLNITVLRPCNVVGPGVQNSISSLLQKKVAPCMAGFSPVMQFIHVHDLGRAIVSAYTKNHPGVYNVAPYDWIESQTALRDAGCKLLPIPAIPPMLPKMIVSLGRIKEIPPFMVNYYKYPVVIDGTLFEQTFHFKPKISLEEIFSYYREFKW